MRRYAIFFLATYLLLGEALAQIGAKVKSTAGNGLAGVWENNEFGFTMTLLLLESGVGEFDGEQINYSVRENILSISSSSGATAYNFVLKSEILTLSGGDLDGPIAFKRRGSEVSAPQGPAMPRENDVTGNSVLGRWEYQGQVLDFQSSNLVVIDGAKYAYQIQGSDLILSTAQGNIPFQYQINEGNLYLAGPGGSITYNKVEGNQAVAGTAGGAEGAVPQELAGKWCYVNVTSNSSGGWSTDECITLYENGTYEYYSENSGSATVTNQYGSQVAVGGTSSQSSDSGTWRLQGNSIIAQSRLGSSQSFIFQKMNHPKNGDPMIVLDGRTYVTQYQKPSW